MTAPSPAAVKFSEEKLPCPFCGSTLVGFMWSQYGRQYVCSKCAARGPQKKNTKEALAVWNARATKDDFIKALIDECAKVASMQREIDVLYDQLEEYRRQLAEANEKLSQSKKDIVVDLLVDAWEAKEAGL